MPLLLIQITANWLWTIISLALLIFHYPATSKIGLSYLVLQVLVVGLLAYFQGTQVASNKSSKSSS